MDREENQDVANVGGNPIYDDSSTLSKNPLHYGEHNGQGVDDIIGHGVLQSVSGCPRICI